MEKECVLVQRFYKESKEQMISLGCDKISLSFGVDTILDNISFSLNEGDRLGIVGVNGAGKSSLFKIITGEYKDCGEVYISKGKTVGILHQNAVSDSSLTLYGELLSAFDSLIAMEREIDELNEKLHTSAPSDEVIKRYTALSEQFRQNGGYEYKNRAISYLSKLGFSEEDKDKSVSTLSGGQKTRLALGKLLLSAPDILLLDEPTNHLDISSLMWLEEILSQSKQTILLISHDRYFLDKVCTKILDIENTHGKIYNGNYSKFTESKEKDREIQRRHYENQQREIARMEAFIEQQKRWNREKNIIAAESRQKAIDRMEKIDAPDRLPDAIRMSLDSGTESGNDVLTVKKLCKKYGDKTIFSDVSFLIKRGDHAFILGRNGCGKSTLMKILTGKLAPSSGSFDFGYNVRVGYYDQENQELDDSKTVLAELWDTFDKSSQTEIRSALALFLFKGDDINKTVGSLSGGEKARLTFVKLFLRKNNVLILDEPTNHLDINSKEALERALENYGGTIIAVSHDRYFIKKLSSRIIDISTVPTSDFRTGFEEYLRAQVTVEAVKQSGEDKISEGKAKYIEERKNAAERRRAEAQYKKAIKESSEAEQRIEVIDTEMEKYATDYIKLAELDTEKTQLEDRLMELYGIIDEYEKSREV